MLPRCGKPTAYGELLKPSADTVPQKRSNTTVQGLTRALLFPARMDARDLFLFFYQDTDSSLKRRVRQPSGLPPMHNRKARREGREFTAEGMSLGHQTMAWRQQTLPISRRPRRNRAVGTTELWAMQDSHGVSLCVLASASVG